MPPLDDKELMRREAYLKQAEAKARNLLAEYDVFVSRYRVCAEQVLEIRNRLNNTKSSVATIGIKIDLKRAEARQELAINALLKKQDEQNAAEANRFSAKLDLDEYRKSMKQSSTPKPKQQLSPRPKQQHQRETKAVNKEADIQQRIQETRKRAEDEVRARAKERSDQKEAEAKRVWEQRKKEQDDEAKKRLREQLANRGPDFARMQEKWEKAEEEKTRQRSRTREAQREVEAVRMQAEEQSRSRTGERSTHKAPEASSPLRERATRPEEKIRFLSEEQYGQKKLEAERRRNLRIQADEEAKLGARERAAQQQAEEEEEETKTPPPVPPHRANPQHDPEIYKAWRQDAEEAFKDYTTMEVFPTPPFPDVICNKPACILSRATRALKICSCDIEKAVKGAGRPIKEERKCWHPDKFSMCREEVREEFQAKAKEVFQVVVRMYAVEKGG
ncbi:uncharacterized protein MYCFIDRAFT_80020 [Pseudocercospora fijiensis CIRAD86]|uniref:Uncharacterized protein n=1 Tax=Pseudocercospora fijiensis (strain CIRAD86) TaxID=383855 RepID=N1QBR9_PSEFD|nr:uncharacterized protein MYCFIDRAFT_80020 [Pseudocercospora fijiensis CIRAD86]EME88648.1 hypothetical protein MYCFIDRAFT_80020 [Pseudocercospora fijiensis CIRAD86]